MTRSGPSEESTALGPKQLRAFQASDIAFAYRLALANSWSFRWAISEIFPPAESFAHGVWARTRGRWIAFDPLTGATSALAVLHGTDGTDDHATLDLIFDDWVTDGSHFWWTASLVAERVLAAQHFHKLYVEIPAALEPHLGPPTNGDWRLECRIGDYFFMSGRHMDLMIYSWISTAAVDAAEGNPGEVRHGAR